MPITIQNNKLRIRNAEGNYVNIDAVSDATVAERLTEINTTAQTQISAIEQKGTETIASIPNDYTELSGEVNDLENAINELNNDVYDKLLSTNVLWSSEREIITGTTYAKKTAFTKNDISAGDYFYFSADSVSGNTYNNAFQIILYDDNNTIVKSVSGNPISLTVTAQYITDGATHAVFVLYASASTPLSGNAIYTHPYILNSGTAVNVDYSDNLGAYIDSKTNAMGQRITTLENDVGTTFVPDEHAENLTCPSAAAGDTAELISDELTANGEYVCFVDPANVSGIVFIGPRKTATGRVQIDSTSGIVNVGTISTGVLYLTSNTGGTYTGDCYVFDVTNNSELKTFLLALSYGDIEPLLGHLVLGKVPALTSELLNDSGFVSADNMPEIKNGVLELASPATSMNSGETINISSFPHYLNKDLGIVFYGTFSTFTSLRIGIGYQEYRGRWIEIDGTNLVIKMANTAETETIVSTNAHGLTFSDYISVSYYVDDDGVESIAIGTNGGTYTTTGNSFMHNGTLFAYAGQSMSNVVFSGIAGGAKKPLWVFGDSYLGFVNDRVMGNLRTLGFTKGICVNALAGLFPGQAYEDLQRMLAISTPKILIWALGMNSDGLYRTTLQQVVALCDEKNIELILYLCPSVPGKDREFVRTAVEGTGLRAINANLAVGASADGSTWYSGYLSDDNVHPTQLGAMALAMRYLVDAPEIMQYRNDV